MQVRAFERYIPLRSGKSSGLYCISNEMLKYGETLLLPCTLKLFNTVLQLDIGICILKSYLKTWGEI